MPRPRPAGRPREYGERVATLIRLPLDLHKRLQREAAARTKREGRTVSINRVVIIALTEWFSGKGRS